jgi:rfaE bifunctional protein kinase chain/domain
VIRTDDVQLLAGHRVLVVGDLVLDEYLTGTVDRISREAPVPVLSVVAQDFRPGSAGNPAANIVALGSAASVIGVVGIDEPGRRLERGLNASGIDASALVRSADAQTATKTRVLARGPTGGRQQMLRLDHVPPLPRGAAAACAYRLDHLARAFDAVLLSDYRGGVVDTDTIQIALGCGRLISVDSQGDLHRFRGVDLVKVNRAEAQAVLGPVDGDELLSRGEQLRRSLELPNLVITLGTDGMAIFDDAGPCVLPAVQATQVFDVTGAGDTVIAVLTLGLLAGIGLRESARLANAAASVVVRRLGVATASPAEIVAALAVGHAGEAVATLVGVGAASSE